MKIYIVRHGQTAWNKSMRWQGNQDVPLDETGIWQAGKLAEKLSSRRVSVIYSSPLKRAAESAEILRVKTGAGIIYRSGLREIRLGEWEGLTTSEISERYGGLFGEWESNPAALIGFGVENMLELQNRAYREFCAVTAGERNDFAIVSHGTWTRCLVCRLLNIPLEGRMSFEVGNAGISVIDCDKTGNSPKYTLITLNDVSHLS